MWIYVFLAIYIELFLLWRHITGGLWKDYDTDKPVRIPVWFYIIAGVIGLIPIINFIAITWFGFWRLKCHLTEENQEEFVEVLNGNHVQMDEDNFLKKSFLFKKF